jgi:hypothetical protein
MLPSYRDSFICRLTQINLDQSTLPHPRQRAEFKKASHILGGWPNYMPLATLSDQRPAKFNEASQSKTPAEFLVVNLVLGG